MSDGPSRPPERRTSLGLRLLGVVGAALLLLALVIAISRDRNPPGDGDGDDPTSMQAPPTTAPAAVEPTRAPSSTPSPADVTLLEDPARAEEAGAVAVLRAAVEVGNRSAADVDPMWRPALERERPVYVGTVEVNGRAVAFDLVVVLPEATAPSVPFRFLPIASALSDAGAGAEVSATVDGIEVTDLGIDAAGALVRVPLSMAPGGPVLVRLRGGYDVPERTAIRDDGGPAGFGLLATSPGVTMLGHGLPVFTFDDAPMVPWGDVGAFPVAHWSVRVRTSTGFVVTGAQERACPAAPEDTGCTWAVGLLLRDLALAITDAGPGAEQAGVAVSGPASTASASRVAQETSGALDSLASRLGPLPWSGVDVVLAPLTQAAGMEFPGLVVVDPEYLDRLGGGFGTFVIAHEVAHQWFHALVGNSSLSDPVVDESLAQFTSLWYLRDAFGDPVADATIDRWLLGRYRTARERGVPERAPASPLADFGGNEVYGPMTYARGAWAWVAVEAQVGADALGQALADLVATFGLREVTAEQVASHLRQDLPGAAVDLLDQVWTSPEPVADMLR